MFCMNPRICPKTISQASGCSLRAAYSYIKGEYPWPLKVAEAVEKATGVSRLHLLWPDDYDAEGNPRV